MKIENPTEDDLQHFLEQYDEVSLIGLNKPSKGKLYLRKEKFNFPAVVQLFLRKKLSDDYIDCNILTLDKAYDWRRNDFRSIRQFCKSVGVFTDEIEHFQKEYRKLLKETEYNDELKYSRSVWSTMHELRDHLDIQIR